MDILYFLPANRCRIVMALGSNTSKTSEIARSLGISKTAASLHLSKLKERGIVRKDGSKFALTGKGEVLALFLRKLNEAIAVMEKHPEFWIEHDVGSIPEHFRLRIGEIGSYSILRGSAANILSHCSALASIIERASFVRGVFSAVVPGLLDSLYSASKRCDVSIIVTSELLEFLDIEILGDVLVNNTAKLVCLTTDSRLCLGLHFYSGEFDLSSFLVSSDPSSVRWGTELFDYFRKSSRCVVGKELCDVLK